MPIIRIESPALSEKQKQLAVQKLSVPVAECAAAPLENVSLLFFDLADGSLAVGGKSVCRNTEGSPDRIFITVQFLQGRSEAQKRQLTYLLRETFAEITGCPSGHINVVFFDLIPGQNVILN